VLCVCVCVCVCCVCVDKQDHSVCPAAKSVGSENSITTINKQMASVVWNLACNNAVFVENNG
jgi:hypothetical protein